MEILLTVSMWAVVVRATGNQDVFEMGESPMQKGEFTPIAGPITRIYNEPVEVKHGVTASQE